MTFNKQYLDYCHPQLHRADTAFRCLGLHTMSCKVLKAQILCFTSILRL